MPPKCVGADKPAVGKGLPVLPHAFLRQASAAG